MSKFLLYLDEESASELEYEVVSKQLKYYLTRKLAKKIDGEHLIIRQNRLINIARNMLGESLYVLEGDDWGHYEAPEYAWHNAEFELVLRRLDTVQFVEYLCFLVEEELFHRDELNELLEKDGLSFRLAYDYGELGVKVFSMEDIEDEESVSEHENIRVLVGRMERSFQADDFAGVLHASASIFETLAKEVVGIPTVENQTLKSFFDRYKKDSTLPEEILDYILEIYNLRNITPLAGHGGTKEPVIDKEQALLLKEMTKAFVKIEYVMNTKLGQ